MGQLPAPEPGCPNWPAAGAAGSQACSLLSSNACSFPVLAHEPMSPDWRPGNCDLLGTGSLAHGGQAESCMRDPGLELAWKDADKAGPSGMSLSGQGRWGVSLRESLESEKNLRS